MRTIDPKWTELAEGYRTVQNLEARLEREFGRALEAGYRQTYLRKLEEWQRKKRVFFALLALAPLSIFTLCLAAVKIKDVACVLVYWAVLIVIILVTLVLSGWGFIKDATNRPQMDMHPVKTAFLEARWWESLSLWEETQKNRKKVEKQDFIRLLAHDLSDEFVAGGGLVLGESGMWLFVTRDWQGAIGRDEGGWKSLRKKRSTVFPGQAPDLEWMEKKKNLVATITERLPQAAWAAEKTQGGVVFTNPKAHLDKNRLQGNTASFGSVRAWVMRMQTASVLEGFPVLMQLEVLDALRGRPPGDSFSAKEQAERLYQQTAAELQDSVKKMVG
jgi:hypothetical protein